jgi:hypothetical protein
VRVIGRVIVGVGVFLLVLAPFMRWYAYPRLAVAPLDQTLRIVSNGPGANVFDTKTLTNIKTNLTATRLVQGDVDAGRKQGDNTDVWVSTVSTVDDQGIVRSRTIERAAFNNNTSASVNCCGEYISITKGVNRPVKHEGVVFKLPFNTQEQTYQFWDLTLRKALPMLYQDTESLDGVTVYKFVQTIKPTPSGKPQKLPANLLDLPGTGNVESQAYYSNIRTIWVEPETGVIIKGQEQQYNTIRAKGRDRLITTKVTIGYSPESVAMLAKTYGDKGSRLHLVRTVLPLIALGSGLVLVGLGLVLVLVPAQEGGARRRPAAAQTEPSEPPPAGAEPEGA